MNLRRSVCFLALGLVSLGILPGHAAFDEVAVETKRRPSDKAWTTRPTRVLKGDLPPPDVRLDAYGGRADRKAKATGFFRVEQVDGRWWLVDPDGGLFLSKGVTSVSPGRSSPEARAAFEAKFGSAEGWAGHTARWLVSAGFNGTGAWSDDAAFRKQSPRLAYAPVWNFMQSYGKKRGGITQQPGHAGYPHDAIFVFDPEFESFCDEHAKQLAATKDDPWLLGHFSDNELPWRSNMLTAYLTLPESEAGHVAAWQWLRERHGSAATTNDVTDADQLAYFERATDRYYSLVSRAIRKYDPNHLFLGSRLHGSDMRRPELFRVAGRHLDVVGVNWYGMWTPDPAQMSMWVKESGRPFLITEWYAKGEDSGMPNTGGAGWLVKTQADRGRFYQNFTLGLLADPGCVGWHWFKYADNDPANTKADPSNRDANKGVVNVAYEPYPALIEAMTNLNLRAYRLRDELGRK